MKSDIVNKIDQNMIPITIMQNKSIIYIKSNQNLSHKQNLRIPLISSFNLLIQFFLQHNF